MKWDKATQELGNVKWRLHVEPQDSMVVTVSSKHPNSRVGLRAPGLGKGCFKSEKLWVFSGF